jgi:hypothetical protein
MQGARFRRFWTLVVVGTKEQSGLGPRFEYLLIRRDRPHVDPAAFQTTTSRWKPGDELMGGDGERYRVFSTILGGASHSYNGVFVVESVEE